MSLKEFLKPDWRKIVIFLIIFLVAPLPGFWSNMNISIYHQKCPNCPFPTPSSGELDGSILNMLVNSDEFYNINSFYYDIINNVLYFIALVLIVYIISCLLVWIYDKLKKKPEKKMKPKQS